VVKTEQAHGKPQDIRFMKQLFLGNIWSHDPLICLTYEHGHTAQIKDVTSPKKAEREEVEEPEAITPQVEVMRTKET